MSPRFAACTLVLAGCLASPPPPGPGPAEEQPPGCAPVVPADLDDPALWTAYAEPGATVVREPDQVHLAAAPSGAQSKAYADLHSQVVIPVGDTELAAAVVVPDPAGVIGGISWTHDDPALEDDDDFYDLIVKFGALTAVRREAHGDYLEICPSSCPPYDADQHAYLRLRAAGGDVHYEFSSDGDGWTELARAPIAGEVYRSIAFAYADAPGASELSVTGMTWTACER